MGTPTTADDSPLAPAMSHSVGSFTLSEVPMESPV